MSQVLRLSPPTVTLHTHNTRPDMYWTESFPSRLHSCASLGRPTLWSPCSSLPKVQ